MKIRAGVLDQSKEALNRLSLQPLLPADSFRLGCLLPVLSPILQRFDSIRVALCTKYGVLAPDGSFYSFPDPVKRQKFNEEMEPLAQEEFEIDVRVILMSSLEKAGIKITAQDVVLLGWLLKEKEEAVSPDAPESPAP